MANVRHMPHTVLTTSEVADRLGVSPSTVRRLEESGALISLRQLPGRNGLLFDQAVVDQYKKTAASDATAGGLAAEGVTAARSA